MPEPVRVAVIDSGVHPAHPHIDAHRIRPGAGFMVDGSRLYGEDEALDRLGHGTAVAAAIQELAPDAVLLPVRVFREQLKASARALAEAIRWAIDQRVDIINLSLGSTNPAHGDLFAVLAQEATEAGCVIIAAYEDDERLCWPGILPDVIGVALDWDVPRGCVAPLVRDGQRVLTASGYPRPIPGVAPARNLYGVSFAVAQMSGLAARAVAGVPRPLVASTLIDAMIKTA